MASCGLYLGVWVLSVCKRGDMADLADVDRR
jgi:hypothetical protein